MSTTAGAALLMLGIFLLVLGYIRRKGGTQAKKWAARVAAIFLIGGIGLALEAPGFSLERVCAVAMTAGGLLALWYKPWRSD